MSAKKINEPLSILSWRLADGRRWGTQGARASSSKRHAPPSDGSMLYLDKTGVCVWVDGLPMPLVLNFYFKKRFHYVVETFARSHFSGLLSVCVLQRLMHTMLLTSNKDGLRLPPKAYNILFEPHNRQKACYMSKAHVRLWRCLGKTKGLKMLTNFSLYLSKIFVN